MQGCKGIHKELDTAVCTQVPKTFGRDEGEDVALGRIARLFVSSVV